MFKMNFIARSVALLILVLILLTACTSCQEGVTAMECDGVTVDEETYRYWYQQLKKYYMDSYSDLIDDEEFWRSEIPEYDMTYGDFIDTKIRNQINYYLAGNSIFDELNLKSVQNSVWKTVVTAVDEEIDDGINAFGSRSAYDKYLDGKYGIDSSKLRSIKLMEQKFYVAYDYLYNSKTGTDKATDSEIAEYYVNNYARIKYYMVLKNFEYRVDGSGNRVVDKNGNYIQDALTDAEKAEKKAYAEAAFESIKNGEKTIDSYVKADFADLLKAYPNGYYLLSNEQYGYLFTTTIVKETFKMSVGDTVICENDDAFFIVQRLELIDNAYKGADASQFADIGSYASNSKFEKRFGEVIERISFDNAITEKYSVISVD